MESAASCEREVVTIQEAMRLARVSRRTIYSWIETGKVEHARTPSRKIRIYADTLAGAARTEARTLNRERFVAIAAKASHEMFIRHRVAAGQRREDLDPAVHPHDDERAEFLAAELERLGFPFPLKAYLPR